MGQNNGQDFTWSDKQEQNNDRNAYVRSLEEQLANANLACDVISPVYPANQESNGSGRGERPFGLMARLKFRSSIAQVSNEKTHDALIDSEGTHHFFHSRYMFCSCQTMSKKDVLSASGMSIIVEKGDVFIPLHGGMFLEAFQTPHFSANNISVGQLSKHFNTLFTTDPPAKNDVSTCFIMLKGSDTTVYSSEIQDGLYKLNLEVQQPLFYSDDEQICGAFETTGASSKPAMKSTVDLALEWHRGTGHPSISRYENLSHLFSDVPYFTQRVF